MITSKNKERMKSIKWKKIERPTKKKTVQCERERESTKEIYRMGLKIMAIHKPIKNVACGVHKTGSGCLLATMLFEKINLSENIWNVRQCVYICLRKTETSNQ